MKKILALLFSSIFLMTSNAQSPYKMYGPSTAVEPTTQAIVSQGFTFSKELMENFTYNLKTYENNTLSLDDTISMLGTDPEELSMYGIRAVDHRMAIINQSPKVTDTVSYQPTKDEIIFHHSSSKHLFDTPYWSHSIEELVYTNDDKIIASQDQNNFIKFFYDNYDNLIEILSYPSSIEFSPDNEDGENGIPVTSLTPYTYVKLSYDEKNRVISKWIYSDQSYLFENTNNTYNEAITLIHYTGKYNNDDQLEQKSITSYRLKNLESESEKSNELALILENPQSVSFNKLTRFFYSKEITPFKYLYDATGKLVSESRKTEEWLYKNDLLEKKATFISNDLSISYLGNTTTLLETTAQANEKGDLKTTSNKQVYTLDEHSFLIEHTSYHKTDTSKVFQIIEKETMKIVYK